MEISFDMTQRDLFAFSLLHTWRRKLIWAVILIVPTAVTMVWFGPEEWIGWGNVLFYWFLLVLFFAVFYWGIAILSIFLRIRTKGFRALLVHQRLVVSESGIQAETPRGKAELNWSAVQKMIATKKVFMIYTTPVNALLFPRRAFGSDEEFREFIEKVKCFHREATAGESGA